MAGHPGQAGSMCVIKDAAKGQSMGALAEACAQSNTRARGASKGRPRAGRTIIEVLAHTMAAMQMGKRQ